jgi:hypothetical protein
MRRARWMAVTLVLGQLMVGGCGSDSGACTGCCGPSDNTYCKDDFSESECSDRNTQQVNGVSWQFYAGQTCVGRGTSPTP